MCYASLGDYRGDIDLTFFPKTWEKYGDDISVDQIIAIKGKIDTPEQRERPCFLVNEILDLDKLLKTAMKKAGNGTGPETRDPENPSMEGPSQNAYSPNGHSPNVHSPNGHSPGLPSPGDTQSPNAAAAACREVHIRLHRDAAGREETLYPLRDYLFENSGPCSVFIHVPVSGGETIIRTATQLSAAGDERYIGALTRCEGVAEVWRE
jgi:DNA polymerase-3 subunit alpha